MRRKRDANRNRGGGGGEEKIDSRREQEPHTNRGEEGEMGSTNQAGGRQELISRAVPPRHFRWGGDK